MSLRWRIALLVAAVLLVAGSASVIAVRTVAERQFRGLVRVSDRTRAQALAPVLADYHAQRGSWEGVQEALGGAGERHGKMPGRNPHMQQGARMAMSGMGARILLLDAAGRVVADSGGLLLGASRPATTAREGVAVDDGGETVGTLFVGTMVDGGLEPADAGFLDGVIRAIILATALSALAALAVGLLMAARIARPVERLTRAAEAAAGGDLDVRVRVRAGGEIGRLAVAFNRMAGSLREIEADRRRLIADSAHELRTPAGIIQGTVEAMIDGVYPADQDTLRDLHAETLRLSRLVADLGELSLLEAGRMEMHRAPTDLAALADAECRRFAAAARDAGVSLAASAEAGLPPVQVDPQRISQVISNLLSNALRHTPSGGRVEASVGHAEGGIAVRVEDSGPGIPPGERERIFERYYRVDGARSGSSGGRGLGLAIAAGIVRAHGGSIRAEASRLGGAAFVISLPAAP